MQARDIMSQPGITVGPDAEVADHRDPVMRKEKEDGTS